MGQKTNPNIFRLGKSNNWKSKYFEKKSTELNSYIIKDLEIKNFIIKYFNDNGFLVQNCKLYYLDKTLSIYISYYNNSNIIFFANTINKIQKFKFTKNKINNNSMDILNKYYYYKKSCKTKRIKNLNLTKNYLLTKKYKNINNIKINSFLENFFESLTQFTHRKLNINLIIKKLNKNTKKNIFFLKNYKKFKKYLTQLRKYSRNKFFKEGINLLFTAVHNKEASQIISKFIANQLKLIKRHNFFLKYIKATLTLFINTDLSNIKGIKIKIKGRINGAPRAKHRIIKIGNNLPILTINQNINYSETTSYSPNGTLGVKVWTCEK